MRLSGINRDKFAGKIPTTHVFKTKANGRNETQPRAVAGARARQALGLLFHVPWQLLTWLRILIQKKGIDCRTGPDAAHAHASRARDPRPLRTPTSPGPWRSPRTRPHRLPRGHRSPTGPARCHPWCGVPETEASPLFLLKETVFSLCLPRCHAAARACHHGATCHHGAVTATDLMQVNGRGCANKILRRLPAARGSGLCRVCSETMLVARAI